MILLHGHSYKSLAKVPPRRDCQFPIWCYVPYQEKPSKCYLEHCDPIIQLPEINSNGKSVQIFKYEISIVYNSKKAGAKTVKARRLSYSIRKDLYDGITYSCAYKCI